MVLTFQQTANEMNNVIQEDISRLDSLLGENVRAQLEIESGLVEVYPRAIPQSYDEDYAPGITYSMYVKMRTTMCGKVTPSMLEPGQPPIRPKIYRTRKTRRFACPICRQRRTRLQHAECHFVPCAETNGNPDGLHWFDHPTVLEYYGKKRSHRRRLGTE